MILLILGFILPENVLGYVTYDPGYTVNWTTAENFCFSEFGTTLATIINESQNEQVQSLCPDTDCWLGATDAVTEGTFLWNSNGEEVTYSDYASDEPNGDGDCLILRHNYTTSKWNDYPCSFLNYIVCDSPTSATKTPTNDPTQMPTSQPTQIPTAHPTEMPIVEPTKVPTMQPTKFPTDSPTINCAVAGLVYDYDWDNSSQSQHPYSDYSIEISASTLSVTFDIELQYIGHSSKSSIILFDAGTTYVVDFQAFDADSDMINHPGTCANRMPSSFQNISWSQYWKYSSTPYVAGHLSSNNYLAYPPSDNWDLSQSIQCTRIKYSATFGWNELRACTNYEGNETLVSITEDNNWINMSGKLFVDMVSPFSMSSETNMYFSKQIIESDAFSISVATSVHALSSADVTVFTISPFTNYRLFDSDDTKDGGYTMTILTEIIDHIYFTSAKLLNSPSYSWEVSQVSDGNCYARLDICYQFWEISASSLSCPLSFDGTFFLEFNASCNPNSNETQACEDYISAFGSKVLLNFDFSYEDAFNCSIDSEESIVQLSSTQSFFENEDFTDAHGDDDEYVRGVDYMYIEIEVDIPSSVESTFEISLINVWLCTCNSSVEDQMSINQAAASTTGCFDTSIVDAGSLHTVMVDGVSQPTYDANIIAENSTKIARLSFLTPTWTGRDKLFVQSQVEVSLVNAVSRRRRLAVGDNVQYNMQTLGEASTTAYSDSSSVPSSTETNVISANSETIPTDTILAVSISFALVLCLLIAIGIYMKRIYNSMKSQLEMSDVVQVRSNTLSDEL